MQQVFERYARLLFGGLAPALAPEQEGQLGQARKREIGQAFGGLERGGFIALCGEGVGGEAQRVIAVGIVAGAGGQAAGRLQRVVRMCFIVPGIEQGAQQRGGGGVFLQSLAENTAAFGRIVLDERHGSIAERFDFPRGSVHAEERVGGDVQRAGKRGDERKIGQRLAALPLADRLRGYVQRAGELLLRKVSFKAQRAHGFAEGCHHASSLPFCSYHTLKSAAAQWARGR